MTWQRNNALPWLLCSVFVLIGDQISKRWILDCFQPGQTKPVIPGFFSLTLTFNTGAAFSFLADGKHWQSCLLTSLAVLISVFLLVWLARTARHDWHRALPLALIIGGAMGNLMDRLHDGHVTDFIEVYYRDWHYPVFNLADCAITLGALLMLIFGVFGNGDQDASNQDL